MSTEFFAFFDCCPRAVPSHTEGAIGGAGARSDEAGTECLPWPLRPLFETGGKIRYRRNDASRVSGQTEKVQMTTIQARVPDPLAKQVEELAQQEKVSVDQLVSIALAYPVSAWRKRGTISEGGKRGDWEKFDRVTAKVRDVPPLPGDEK